MFDVVTHFLFLHILELLFATVTYWANLTNRVGPLQQKSETVKQDVCEASLDVS